MPNHYTTLRLLPTATETEVKAAFLDALDQTRTAAEIVLLQKASAALQCPLTRLIHDAELAVPPALQADLAALGDSWPADPALSASRLANLARQNPHPALLLAAGALLYATSQFYKASRVLGRLVDQDPGHAAARAYLGLALFEEGRRADALPHLEAATRLDPRQAEACCALAEAQLFQGVSALECIALLDRSLDACAGLPTEELRLQTCLLLPIALLQDQPRMQATAARFMDLFPIARHSAQEEALHRLANLCRMFSSQARSGPRQYFEQLAGRLGAHFNQFRSDVPSDPALEEERQRFQRAKGLPEWLFYVAGDLYHGPDKAPLTARRGSPFDQATALFKAQLRVQPEQMDAEWAAFAADYPRLAARLQEAWMRLRAGSSHSPGQTAS